MTMQLIRCSHHHHHHHLFMIASSSSSHNTPLFPCSSSSSALHDNCYFNGNQRNSIPNLLESFNFNLVSRRRSNKNRSTVVVASSSSNTAAASSLWDAWKPDDKAPSPPLSDVIWPSAGAFAAMAIMGKIDQMLAPKGISMTIAPFGAVCAVLFAAPSSPAAKKYNVFMAQIGCAAFGVLAFSVFGPGWLARSVSLAASIAFMIYTRTVHPPAASLPILFIDAAKLHHLNLWYALFPGAAGCILLCLIQEMVCYLKDNFKF